MAPRAPRKTKTDPLALRSPQTAAKAVLPYIHKYGKSKSCICETDTRGFKTPQNKSPLEIVVDASEGFIPLWDEGVTLRWRFNKNSLLLFEDPEKAQDAVRKLFGEAILQWGDAAPIKFSEKHDAWDFEIEVSEQEKCSLNGCVLASAFFPDEGRHKLVIYPTMFEQSRKEQVETLVHEIGHIFGLRHFFAKLTEEAWPAKIFGKHKRFSIMNYGPDSRLTARDKSDLKKLYSSAWSRELEKLGGTPIKLFRPFSSNNTNIVVAEFRFKR